MTTLTATAPAADGVALADSTRDLSVYAANIIRRMERPCYAGWQPTGERYWMTLKRTNGTIMKEYSVMHREGEWVILYFVVGVPLLVVHECELAKVGELVTWANDPERIADEAAAEFEQRTGIVPRWGVRI